MGASKSKVRKLSPKTIAELQKNLDVDYTREEIEEWYMEYQATLGKGESKLTMREFREVYNSVFDGDADEFVKHLFRSFDMDKDGYVDFKEFIVGLCVSGSERPEVKLKWAFKMYDIDENGYISREEMLSMLRAIYRMISTDMSNIREDFVTIEQLVAEFFLSADINRDNFISQEEFVAGVTDMPVILHLLQCDPDTHDMEPGPVKKFDHLDEIKKATTKASSGNNHREPAFESDRRHAYAAQ